MSDAMNVPFKKLMQAVAVELYKWGGAFATTMPGSTRQYISSDVGDYGYIAPAELVDGWVFDIPSQKQYRITDYSGPDQSIVTVSGGVEFSKPTGIPFWIFLEPPVTFASAVRRALRQEGGISFSIPEYREFVLPKTLTRDEYEQARAAGQIPRPENSLAIPDLVDIAHIEVSTSIYPGTFLGNEHWEWDSDLHILRFASVLQEERIRVFGTFDNTGFVDNWDLVDSPLALSDMRVRNVSDKQRARLIYSAASLWMTSTFMESNPDQLNKAQRISRHFRDRIDEDVAPVASSQSRA